MRSAENSFLVLRVYEGKSGVKSNVCRGGGGGVYLANIFHRGFLRHLSLASRELTAFQEANVSENTVVTFNQKS